MGLSEAGPYTLVSCHLEGLRSSLSPTLHLTQLAATTSTSYTDNSTFFRAIAPPGLGSYLDECRVGGDLLQVLHMAREDRGTFLFRPPVLVEQVALHPLHPLHPLHHHHHHHRPRWRGWWR